MPRYGAHMPNGFVTVLWFLDPGEAPPDPDARYHHVLGDAERPRAAIARHLADGPVLAVVRTDEDARNVLACGADEVVLYGDAQRHGLDSLAERAQLRARARLNRDLFLIDLVRKDDTNALALFAAALGRELAAPLSRATEETREILDQMATGDESTATRAQHVLSSFENVVGIVEKTQALLDSTRTDETVDLYGAVQDVASALTPAVHTIADLVLDIPRGRCIVGIPRWQIVLVVANLIANSSQSVAAKPGRRGQIVIRVVEVSEAAVLEVTDDGVGMDARVRVHANDLFYTTEHDQHLGLGLTLVTSRVRRAGGEVMIDSEAGGGTTIRVFLPIVSSDALPKISN